MVWGCFAAGGVGAFIQVKGILVKEKYKQILIHHAVPSGTRLLGCGILFQQDNDSKHTAHIVKDYLSTKETDGTLSVLPWVSQSPDLNPIKHLWKILDDNCDDRNPQNHAQIFATPNDGWESLHQNKLNSLMESMPRRCQAVVDAKGYPTKY